MMLHLITDRMRLLPDGDEAMRETALVAQATYGIAAGIDVIQIREPDLPGRSLVRLTRAIVQAAAGSSTRVLVNDRLDVALAAGAAGVHLKGHSVDAGDVRRIAPPGFLLGRSVRSVDEAHAAGPVDYLIAGTVWATPSKPAEHRLLGVDGLQQIALATSTPVIAIGGVTPGNVARVTAAGGAGVAAIGAFMGSPGHMDRVTALFDIVRSFRETGAPDKMNG